MSEVAQTLVAGMTDENGVVDVESPSVDADINIRDDGVELFETATGRLLIAAPTLTEGAYIEAIPSADGVQTTVVENPSADLSKLDPADPAENDVDADVTTTIEVRMD